MEIIITKDAPTPIGAYSQAVKVNKMIFCSGQVPIDPATGKLVEGDFRARVEQVLKNIKAVLEQAESSLNEVVKTTVFMTDLKQFSIVNEVYQAFFDKDYPARSVVQVTALPLGTDVEIEVIAVQA